MFSLDSFYHILYKNLLQPATIAPAIFEPFGSVSPSNLNVDKLGRNFLNKDKNEHFSPDVCLFYDQEPLIKEFIEQLDSNPYLSYFWTLKILANSEHSAYKKEFCKTNRYLDWYYFFHGFAALDWYRDYLYMPNIEYNFNKVFISLNRLVTKDRSYRLNLVSCLLEKNLVEHGNVSLILQDIGYGTWRDEIRYANSKLSEQAKIKIIKNIGKLKKPLIVDYENPPSHSSASFSYFDVMLNKSALWHLVSETVFYYPKLHLTEKIFKPIVSKRPFILVAAPGNLAYLKSYGFKTFDRWIDESYDLIEDSDLRIAFIVEQLERLCKLSRYELEKMHDEMKDILEYNFNHFFKGDFKKIIVNEMIDNFETCIRIWNNGRSDLDGRGTYTLYKNLNNLNFNEVKNILVQ